MDDGSEAGFTIEEVIGPDGRYVLYYRWPDGSGSGEGADPPGAQAPASTGDEPLPDV